MQVLTQRHRDWLTWVWLALVPIANWPAAKIPFERDEGEYLLAATLANHGGLAYRDVFLQKPPGIVLLYRGLLQVTDGSAQSIHILLLGVYTLTALGLGVIALKLTTSRSVAAMSMIFFAMSLSTPMYQASAANTEAFMVAAIVFATYCLLKARETGRTKWVVFLGFALGVAGMMKQTAAPHVLWFLPALVFAAKNQNRVRWPLIATAAATITVLSICMPYFLQGGGTQLLDGVIFHNFEYTNAKLEKAFYDRLDWINLDVELFHIALWLCAFMGFVLGIAKKSWWVVATLGAWALTAWVGVDAGSVFRGHYFIQLLPPVAIAAAYAIVVSPMRTRIGGTLAMIAFWTMSNGIQWHQRELVLAQQRYHTLFFNAAIVVGDWIRKQPDRSLYILGSEPEIYYYAGSTPVTRYVIQNPLFGGFASSPPRQSETWHAVTRARPKWIVTVSPRVAIPFFPGSDPWLLDRMDSLLVRRYTPRMATVSWGVALVPFERIPKRARRNMTIWERID
jgi:hypothetical protein